jgi:hypothetical protein
VTMTLTWCVNGDSPSVADEDSVACLVHTFIMPFPTLICSCLFAYRMKQIKPFRIFTHLDSISTRNYYILILCCISLIILIPLFHFIELPMCGSLIFSVCMQVFGYLYLCKLMTKECYRLTHWPGKSIKLYLSLSLLTLIAASVSVSSHIHTPTSIVLVCAQFIISVIANLSAWLKDYFLTPEDASKLELDRVSVLDYEYSGEDSHLHNQLVSTRGGNRSSWSFSGPCRQLHSGIPPNLCFHLFRLIPFRMGAVQRWAGRGRVGGAVHE